MRVSEIFEKRAAFSFEVFPPKTDVGMQKLCGEGGVLDQLYTLNPDYISCTYGAGGTNVGKNLEVLDKIRKDGKCTPVTHFTCIGNTKEGIKDQLNTYLAHGINHMLALRGDLPFGWTGTGGDLHYATELVKFVRQEFGDKFTIAVAGSPEGHIACRSLEADIAFLKQKQDNGADYIMTQLCWDMDQFRYWLDAIRGAGIWLPVDVGIMPILLRHAPEALRDHLQALDLPQPLRQGALRRQRGAEEGRLQGGRYRVYHQPDRRVSRLRHRRHPPLCPQQVRGRGPHRQGERPDRPDLIALLHRPVDPRAVFSCLFTLPEPAHSAAGAGCVRRRCIQHRRTVRAAASRPYEVERWRVAMAVGLIWRGVGTPPYGPDRKRGVGAASSRPSRPPISVCPRAAGTGFRYLQAWRFRGCGPGGC